MSFVTNIFSIFTAILKFSVQKKLIIFDEHSGNIAKKKTYFAY